MFINNVYYTRIRIRWEKKLDEESIIQGISGTSEHLTQYIIKTKMNKIDLYKTFSSTIYECELCK